MSADDSDAAEGSAGERRRRRRTAMPVETVPVGSAFDFGFDAYDVTYADLTAPAERPQSVPTKTGTPPAGAALPDVPAEQAAPRPDAADADPVQASATEATGGEDTSKEARPAAANMPEEGEPSAPQRRLSLRNRLTGRRAEDADADAESAAPGETEPHASGPEAEEADTVEPASAAAADPRPTPSETARTEEEPATIADAPPPAPETDPDGEPAPPGEEPFPEPESDERPPIAASARRHSEPVDAVFEPVEPEDQPSPAATANAESWVPEPSRAAEPSASSASIPPRDRLRQTPGSDDTEASVDRRDRPAAVPRPSRRNRTPGTGTIEAEGPILSVGPDSERNRRAQRIDGGGSVIIGDRLFELVDWSALGISIRSDEQLYKVGDVEILELEIDLDDYAVNLDLDAEVVNRNSQRTGWRFLDPTEMQRQVLRSLVHAATTGRSFTAPRGPAGTVRGDGARFGLMPPPETPPRRRRRFVFSPIGALMSLPFNAAVIALISGMAILAMSGGDVPGLDPVEEAAPAPVSVTSEAAAVAVESITVTATLDGLVLGWSGRPGDTFTAGEALVSFAADLDETAPQQIGSPCNCTLARILMPDGKRVEAGAILGLMYPQSAGGHVQATFASGEAPSVGDRVSVELPYSGETVDGTVLQVGQLRDPDAFIGLPLSQTRATGMVVARIATIPTLPPALAGSPVVVTAPAPPPAPDG